MKWYSVKKYKPSLNIGTYFVITKDGQLWTADWYHNRWKSDSEDEEICGVTHFCIPDPVEVEE